MHPFIIFLLCAIIMVTVSCSKRSQAPVYKVGDKEYGIIKGTFTYRWWNYYERGLSYAEGEFFHDAISDLENAIEQRHEDQRMARTYGMHLVDYFPHRETGIIYYEMGDYINAKNELELSIQHYPSAKAHYFLDRVRKAILEKTTKDSLPPKIVLDFSQNEIWTKNDPVIVSGFVEDAHYISSVAIEGKPLFFEGSKQKIIFKESLKLARGKHRIGIEAKNLLGVATSTEITVHVDRDGPALTIEKINFDENDKNQIIIQGSVYDDSGLEAVIINGREVLITKSSVSDHFSKSIKTDEDTITIEAYDKLGNQTLARTSLSDLTTENFSILLASLDSEIVKGLISSALKKEDTYSPMIHLKEWSDFQTVYLEKIYLEGQIRDDKGVSRITINGVPVLCREGKRIFFSYFFDLDTGENRITIEATDNEGNVSNRTITILRKVPEAMLSSERLSLMVLPFGYDSMEFSDNLFFQGNLIGSLMDQNRFRIVERDKLDLILNEHKLSATDLVDKATAVKVGKLIAARSILTGNIIKTRNGFEVIGRLVDTETSEILSTEDAFSEYVDIHTFKHLSDGLAIKLHRDFPLITGQILKCKGNHIFINLGRKELARNRSFILFREEDIKDTLSNKSLGSDYVVVGRARLTQFLQEISKAELTGCSPAHIKEKYGVITE